MERSVNLSMENLSLFPEERENTEEETDRKLREERESFGAGKPWTV